MAGIWTRREVHISWLYVYGSKEYMAGKFQLITGILMLHYGIDQK